MSILDIFNRGVKPNAGGPGVMEHPPAGGKQRSFFLTPDVKASSLSNTLSDNLHLKGHSKSTDANGKPYSPGFTPDVDYYVDKTNVDPITGLPVERGFTPLPGIVDSSGRSKYGNPTDTNDILDTFEPAVYDAFKDKAGYEWRHHLDRGEIPIGVELTKNSDIYLTSFSETDMDNEDPVSFGYDIIIDFDNSPLFNGAVEDFINNFSSYAELYSRLDTITKFKEQFFKFFKVNTQNLLGLDEPRTYYLKKISGLNGLTEDITSGDSKQFVDYGKDFITLGLKEDVSVNTGYLAALYKLLTWSRVHGKKMIPDNLLRFDVEIVVTEARKFNRVRKNDSNTLDQFADLVSRYRYKVYECQFFFGPFSHGDSIDMSGLEITDGFDIKFNYKFSTMLFEKFTNTGSVQVGSDITRPHNIVDNSQINVGAIDPSKSNSFISPNGTIILNPIDYVLNKYYSYTAIGLQQNAMFTQGINAIDTMNQDKISKNDYQTKLDNLHVPTAITSITKQSSLLQKTLAAIETSFKADLKRTIYTLKQDLLDFIPKNLLGGSAFYTNKAFNTLNNTLHKSLTTIRKDIYEQKNIFVQTQLMGINNVLDTGNNALNNALGKLGGENGNNPKTKPGSIYDTGPFKPIVYTGTDVPHSDPAYVAPNNKGGFGKDGYEINLDEWNKNHP